MRIKNKYLFLLLLDLFHHIFGDRCCQIGNRESPMYKITWHERQSTGMIISRREVENLENCVKFAVSKKALAFNYRQTTIANHRRGDYWENSNCQALECPVIDDFGLFINDTRFDYYSIYRLQRSSENTSLKCLPRVGIFYISEESLNYTNARESCRKMHGALAHIASEERTEGLGKMINDVPTFVGLSNRERERIWKNEFDEPMSCFDYRGWAEQEPANSRGCVVLVRPGKSHSSSSWKVSSCSQKFPYICEIMPRSRKNRRMNNRQ